MMAYLVMMTAVLPSNIASNLGATLALRTRCVAFLIAKCVTSFVLLRPLPVGKGADDLCHRRVRAIYNKKRLSQKGLRRMRDEHNWCARHE